MARPSSSPTVAARDAESASQTQKSPGKKTERRDDERKRLDLDVRREQLLLLGLQVFSARAYDEVSIDDIAQQAGISKGLLYHYFGGKRDFYVAVVKQAADHLVEATDATHLPTPERAREGLSRYLDFAEAHSGAFVTLLRGGIGNDAVVQEVIESTRLRILDRIFESIGLQSPSPMFRLAMRSYLGLVESATVDFLERRSVDRATLLQFLITSIQSLVTTAIELDAKAEEASLIKGS